MISRIIAATGVVQWTFAGINNSGIYQSLELLVLPDATSVLIVVTGTTTNRIYAKLVISSAGIVTSSMQLTENTPSDLI